MKNNDAIVRRIFNWANGQITAAAARRDFATFKKAVVLAAVCANSNFETTIIKGQLIAIDLHTLLQSADTNSIQADIPFFITYHKLLGHLPLNIFSKLCKIQADIKEEIEAGGSWRSLAAFLLIAQINPATLNAGVPCDISDYIDHPVPYYLSADDNELNALVYAIHIYSGFGTQRLTTGKMLEPILEVRMLAALRNYNLIHAGYILTALEYLGAGHKNSAADTIKFLVNNQSEEGFIGYYGREFETMKMTEKDRTGFLLSSTLISAIAIVEHNSSYRFYQNIFRKEVEFAQPEFI